MDQESSSLDRFLRNRAPVLLGVAWGRFSVVVNGGLGVFFTLMGLGLMAASLFTCDKQMFFGGFGPLFGGVVNLAVAVAMKRRSPQTDAPTVRLSNESKEFLHKLMRQAFGWRYSWAGYDYSPAGYPTFGWMAARRRWRHWARRETSLDQKAAEQFLRPEVFAVLEEASKHYNRIQGCFALAQAEGGGALKKLRPAIVEAADETIADVIHQAAMMERFPESRAQGEKIAAQKIASMKEAADRVESIQCREPSLVDHLTPSSTMDAVLEELRMEEMARSELQKPEDKQQQLGQS